MRMKRAAAAITALVTALAMTACSFGFDASKYVKGVLDNIYLGDSTAYMDMVEISKEEAQQEYEQGIEVEVDYFLQYYDIDPVSDEVRQQVLDLYKQIYQKSKYEVKDAVKNGTDYNVEVLVSPIDIIVNNEDAIVEAYNGFLETANAEDYATDTEIDDALAGVILEVLNNNMANLGYQEAKSVIVKIEKDADGYYGLSDDAVSNLDQNVIAY